MTEGEARTKWCPQVRMDGCEEVQNSFNRVHATDGSGLSQALCVASDCMLWKAEEATVWEDIDGNLYSGPLSGTEQVVRMTDAGCCGLSK